MNMSSNPAYELNNNLEFLKTPVKSFARLDYKKLQTFVAAMGLPSNLKRKQLLAIIVAKKMGKDNMIPAILKEVTRQRNQKKRYVREIIQRHKLDDPNNKIYSPKFAPLPPPVTESEPEEKTAPAAPRSVNPQYLSTLGLAPAPPNQHYQYQPCYGFENSNQANEINIRERQIQYLRENQVRHSATIGPSCHSAPSTITSSAYDRARLGDPPAYDFFDNVITKKYDTLTTQTTIVCREILHMEPATSITPWYHQPLSCAMEFKSQYIISNDPPTAGPSSRGTIPRELEDEKLNQCKNGNEEYNLDAILDYVMEDDKKPFENTRNEFLIDESTRDSDSSHLEINLDVDSNSSQMDPDPDTTRSSFDSDTEQPNSIHEMMLLYYALLTNRALWPLKRYTLKNDAINDYIFDCLSPINSDTNICFSQTFCGIPHPYELYSNYKPKACMYNDAYASQNAENNLPDRCLLQPENSLSYGVPKMYYRSRNYSNEHSSSYSLHNYCFQPNQQEDMSRFAYASPQIQYNIHLPNERASQASPQPSGSGSYVDLKPRPKRVADNSVLNVEATIPPLSPEEELDAYNSLEDIHSINLPQDASQQIHKAEHESQCFNTKIACPFLFTYCNWFENVPLMAKHIREMHSEKIVSKKSAEYFINFVQLEMLKDRGVKIIQEHNNRLCYISLCIYNAFVCITVQELCESFECHGDKLKAGLLLKHSSGHRLWSGFINSMIFPLSHLWKHESALMVPIYYLKSGQAKHFRLQVDLGI